MMNGKTSPSSLRKTDISFIQMRTLSAIAMSLIALGCEQPIYESIELVSTTTPTEPPPNLRSVSEAVGDSNRDDYTEIDWPLSNEGYVVTKPPKMAYVTDIDGGLQIPDPTQAKVEPWDPSKMTKDMDQTMRFALDTSPLSPRLQFELKPSQYDGHLAYDLADDGKRMVTINDGKLTLYRIDTSEPDTADTNADEEFNPRDASESRIGRLDLPPPFGGNNKPVAIRMCGTQPDFLIVSGKTILRMGGKDGAVIKTVDGPGELIEQLTVSNSDEHLMIRTSSGKVFVGDSGLETITKLDLGRGNQIEHASLNSDATLLGVIENNHLKTYSLDDYQVIGEKSYDQFTLNPNAQLVMSRNSHAAVDSDGLLLLQTGPGKEPRVRGDRMLWRPDLIQAIDLTESKNRLLMIGRRVAQGRIENIVFMMDHNWDATGRAETLDHHPDSFLTDQNGKIIVTEENGRLRVLRRQSKRATRPVYLTALMTDWIASNHLSQFEHLSATAAKQNRLLFGETGESIRSRLLRSAGLRWAYLEEHDPENQAISNLQSWLDQGSAAALTASAFRHNRLGWKARGTGYAHQITAAGGREYERRISLAREQLGQALLSEHPPLLAFELMVAATLEDTGDLQGVNAICQRSLELYPGETQPHIALAFKLLPRWYGESGDAISLARSVADLHTRNDGDLVYLEMVSNLSTVINPRDRQGWVGLDLVRAKRGFEVSVKKDSRLISPTWLFFYTLATRRNDAATQRKAIARLMELTPHKSSWIQQYNPPILQTAFAIADKIWSDAESRSSVSTEN